MEIMDLYDVNRQKTSATYIRGSAQPKGYYRLVVHVCIFNSKNELLIQRRTYNKKMPGLWDVTCGGAVSTTEDSNIAASRELFEELGIKLDMSKLRPSITANFSHGFDDFYVINEEIDIKSLILQEDEVSDARWESLDGVIRLLRTGQFVGYRENFIRFLFDLGIDNKYVNI